MFLFCNKLPTLKFTYFIDEVTWINKNLIKQDRSRISVLKKLKQLEIIPRVIITC